MVDNVVLLFVVHQPNRITDLRNGLMRNYFKESSNPLDVLESMYDRGLDRMVFERVSERCYVKTTRLLTELVEEHPEFKLNFSVSGTWLEQAERYGPEALEEFRKLVSTGNVELLCQTYYHSIVSLSPNGLDEFGEQVELHRRVLEEKFGYRPRSAENTEFIYHNEVGKKLWRMGIGCAVTEAVERILGGRKPYSVYRAKGCGLKLLLRDYVMSDDVGFRFSMKSWDQYPLTADKYASWVKAIPGDLLFVAMDYETFGEHHDESTGILEFLEWLPKELEKRGVSFMTVSEACEEFEAEEVYDVPREEVVSWADVEKDASAWVGNPLQDTAMELYFWLEPYAKAVGGPYLENWRRLGGSDYYHYMSLKGGPSGEVHTYFSPFADAFKAFSAYMEALTVLSYAILKEYLGDVSRNAWRLRLPRAMSLRLRRPDGRVAVTVRSLRELLRAVVKMPPRTLARHVRNGDIQRWIKARLLWPSLAGEVERLRRLKAKRVGEELLSVLEKSRHGVEG